ncbi:acid beta-fructofuranosidase-like [Juglans microcarpa x Juglans regia]|uniref:acid beta-fructofuranosidase-like n=1 Tax=Juglans microcarpa x Juglans regia TaxID=2249226 RepID=UPI001B7E3193|nr:acid beta-fructofuranosidase-like [Juglans microcarpa x Juglans regia]
MVVSTLLRSFSSKHEDPAATLPSSTTPLLYEPRPGELDLERRWPPKRAALVVIFGFLLLALFLAILIADLNSDVHANGNVSLATSGSSMASEPLKLVSRGVSAGVSEKANRVFACVNVVSFPWNNTMLSWQRTAYHFQPEKNWMNDPNGPMYYKGWYHFFYQYNPNGAVWGDIVWGHAVSKDLIHWLHLPLAMVADQWYDMNGVWTGSATILPDGQVIMLYTGSTNESVQVQNLAYPANLSDPLLINWVKYSGNPVLHPPPGIDSQDFRDPTTAWYTSDGKWNIAIGSKVNKTGITLIYSTEDFKNFELLDGVLYSFPGTGMWECVDFFPVSNTSIKGLDTSVKGPGVKHVIKTSLDQARNDYYAVGTYDEKAGKWVPDNTTIGLGLRYDYGMFYASKSFYDLHKGRRVLWGWIQESDSEIADVKKGWASVQSIPRTVLLDTKTGTNLLQWPVEEVDSLRLTSKVFDKVEVKAGSVVPLDVGTATQVDIVAEFELDKEALERTAQTNVEFSCSTSGGAAERGALGPFGLLVLADESLNEHTPVYFYIAKGTDGNLTTFFCADQTRSSEATDVDKKIYGSTIPVLKDEKLSVRLLVDHSIIESFAQGGRTCITSRVYPTKAIYGAARIFLFNNATEASVTSSLKIWQMNSAFIRPFRPEQDH